MSGFFERMAARALGAGEGAGPALRARVPQPYESGAVRPGAAGRASRPPAGPHAAAPPGWPAWPDEGPDAPVEPPGSEAGGPPWSEPERWGSEQAAGGGEPAQPRQRGPRAGAAEGTRPSGPDLAAAGRGAAAPPAEAGRAPQPPRQARQAQQPQGRRTRRPPPSRPSTAGLASAPPAGAPPAEWDGPLRGGDRAPPAPAVLGQDPPPRHLRPPRPAAAVVSAPTGTPAADRAGVRPAFGPVRPPGRVEAASAGISGGELPAVDVVALLRDHVVPALTDRGDLDRGERPRIVANRAGHPTPPAGTIAVAPGRVDVRGTPVPPGGGSGGAPARSEVHVHIDRVVVTRAPAPAATPPEPPPGADADHAAYLARRRERQ